MHCQFTHNRKSFSRNGLNHFKHFYLTTFWRNDLMKHPPLIYLQFWFNVTSHLNSQSHLLVCVIAISFLPCLTSCWWREVNSCLWKHQQYISAIMQVYTLTISAWNSTVNKTKMKEWSRTELNDDVWLENSNWSKEKSSIFSTYLSKWTIFTPMILRRKIR